MAIYAIYTRISADKTGDNLAVDRQEVLIKADLKRRGFTAGKVYCDNSVSATSATAKRPAYEAMIADWEGGQFQGIAAYDMDRLWRHPSQLEEIIDAADKKGLQLVTVAGDADLSTDNGRLFARIKAAVAKAETERRSQRQKDKFAQNRQQGKNFWKGRRPFGLELDGNLREVEAQALQTVAEKILDGATLASCVAWINEQGIKTTFDQEWTRTPLKRTLLHPRLVAKMEHEGELVEGNWKPVLDEATWVAVKQMLESRSIPQTKNTEKEYLLSGIATCFKCGAVAYGARIQREAKGRAEQWAYRCSDRSAHFSKTMNRTDTYVIERTLALISVPGAEETYTSEASQTDIKALRNKRVAELNSWSEWLTEAAEEGLKPSEYRKPRELHEARLKAIDEAILDYERNALFSDLFTLTEQAEQDLRNAWDDLPLERRRRVLRTLWKSIIIEPTARGVRWSEKHIHLEPTEKSHELQLKQYVELLKKL